MLSVSQATHFVSKKNMKHTNNSLLLFSSIPLRGKSKTEEMDPKKQKKFEKEEKDFRKKFKVC